MLANAWHRHILIPALSHFCFIFYNFPILLLVSWLWTNEWQRANEPTTRQVECDCSSQKSTFAKIAKKKLTALQRLVGCFAPSGICRSLRRSKYQIFTVVCSNEFTSLFLWPIIDCLTRHLIKKRCQAFGVGCTQFSNLRPFRLYFWWFYVSCQCDIGPLQNLHFVHCFFSFSDLSQTMSSISLVSSSKRFQETICDPTDDSYAVINAGLFKQ